MTPEQAALERLKNVVNRLPYPPGTVCLTDDDARHIIAAAERGLDERWRTSGSTAEEMIKVYKELVLILARRALGVAYQWPDPDHQQELEYIDGIMQTYIDDGTFTQAGAGTIGITAVMQHLNIDEWERTDDSPFWKGAL